MEDLPAHPRQFVPVPPAPREFPANFLKRYVLGSAFPLLFGGIFLVTGIATGLLLLALGILVGDGVGAVVMSALFGGSFGGIGAIFFWFGYRRWSAAREAYRKGSTTMATVKSAHWSKYRMNHKAAAVYQFEFTVNGETYKGEHHSWKPLDLKQGVCVLYSPRNPRKSVVYEPEQYLVTDPEQIEAFKRGAFVFQEHTQEHVAEHIQAPIDW